MANPDRLTALDSTFLHLEDHSAAHMHVASVMVFEGAAPTLQELVEHVEGRLHLVPRYRQRLAYVPFFFALDIAVAAWSSAQSLLRRPLRWSATERADAGGDAGHGAGSCVTRGLHRL